MGSCKAPEKLLQRPAHKIPAATWHLQDADSIAAMASKGPLSRGQLEAFYRDGFVVLEDFYSAAVMQQAQADVERQVDTLARDLLVAGKVTSLHEDLDWTSRLNRL